MSRALVFDLDGVLMDTENVWAEVKQEVVTASGGRWRDDAPGRMIGMSSPEWSEFLRVELGVPMEAEAINAEVVRRVEEHLRRELPLIDGAPEAVERMAAVLPLGLASSANREIIDLFLELSGLGELITVSVSSEEVARGKPAPDVFLEAVRRLGADPSRSVAVEDSDSGIRAAHAAGMRVLALPNPDYPPDPEALAKADVVLDSLADLTPERALAR